CEVREKIPACGGSRPSSLASSPSLPVTPSAYAQPKAMIAPARNPAPEFCTGKADGVYSTGCETYFHTCTNGVTYKMACPPGLFYDIAHKMCDSKENIVACGGARPAIPAAPSVPSPYGSPMVTPSPVRDVVPVVPLEKFCSGKADGVHSEGCQTFYYSCTNGITYKMLCPSGLFYD
ncbi:hypothetical protein PMAYCL1PPCAC_02253, partial [Pristionchus mayeri]